MTDNVYYDPEKFGLTVVGEVEWTEEMYTFDTTVVWRDGEGNYFTASDGGCSCPTPFEDFTSVSDLAGPHTAHEIADFLNAELAKTGEWRTGDYEAQVAGLIGKVMA